MVNFSEELYNFIEYTLTQEAHTEHSTYMLHIWHIGTTCLTTFWQAMKTYWLQMHKYAAR